MAAQPFKTAIPSHLKSASNSSNLDEAEFAKRHHGKTRSHMVSDCYCTFLFVIAGFL